MHRGRKRWGKSIINKGDSESKRGDLIKRRTIDGRNPHGIFSFWDQIIGMRIVYDFLKLMEFDWILFIANGILKLD